MRATAAQSLPRRSQRAGFGAIALGVGLASCLALAQGRDEPVPYPTPAQREQKPFRDFPGIAPAPKTPPPLSPPPLIPAVTEDADKPTSEEDRSSGFAGELLAGVMLVDSSKGQLVDLRFSYGVRFTWEFGRLFKDETLREALFSDFTWSYVKLSDGTNEVFVDTNYHYFTIAPAYDILFGHRSPYGFFLQVGAGFAYEATSLHYGRSEAPQSGFKTLLQYGIGVRGRPLLFEGGKLRLAFRFEVTRFRRSYMDDTFLGGSIGAAF